MASFHLKGGWKETRGLQKPILAETPVSESWMPLPARLEQASLAVPTEGGGGFSPPGGGPGSMVRGHLPRRDPKLDNQAPTIACGCANAHDVLMRAAPSRLFSGLVYGELPLRPSSSNMPTRQRTRQLPGTPKDKAAPRVGLCVLYRCII